MPSPEPPGAGGPDDHEHEHRSLWPFVAAIGAGLIYAGLAVAIFAFVVDVATPLIGVAVAAVGGIVTLGSLGGWLVEAFFAPPRGSEAGGGRDTSVAATVLFLVTDVHTFAALFVYYFFIRVGAWPPEELPHLLSSLVLVNTLILIASSVTLHFAHEALDDGRGRRFTALLWTTFALGVVFLGGQALEYYEFLVAEGFTVTSGVYASAFYGLTGLHGFHVAIGVGALGVLGVRATRGAYGPDRDTGVETVSLYWHFVDVVWLFLVAVLYAWAAL
ncbi:heme-copper oxidase subunit III [Natrialbaceae archaeon GCM10025810]|uniref:cytochrome c oxidase subunit 3 n=1 Tax=Halovalidus salilacus TaxID=3075124 RepID=UPI00361F8DDA